MLVAITGASGFIGQHLVLFHRSKGDKVRVLSRKESIDLTGVEFYQADLTNPDDDLDNFVNGVDVLYHCAGELKDEKKMPAIHIDGTRRLAQAAAGKIGRWIQLSSVGAYGTFRSGRVNEQTKELPVGVYEKTKTISDNIVREFFSKKSFELVIIRPSIVYAIDMPNQSLFQLVSLINKGIFFYIGSKKTCVNYVHLNDVINALYLCASHPDAIGNTYILSVDASMQKAMESFAQNLTKKISKRKLPEKPLRILTYLFKWLPRFPLSQSRIDVLTNQVIYDGELIVKQLNFKYSVSIVKGFQEIASEWKIKN